MEVIDARWISSRLTGRRGERAELARFIGVKPDVVTKILSGERRVQPEEIPRVLQYFEQGGIHEVPNGSAAPEGADLVPVYDVSASAGHGAVVDVEEHISNLAFSTQYLREMTSAKGNQLVAIRVKGDSMTPTIQDDDMVVIDRTKTNLDYDGLFVLRVGEALQIKRIGRGSRRTSVMVIADNSLYPPVDTERTEIDVVGKVIWYGRKV
ncbi:S24 family peptidase [Roseinatronobacter alkalisoli]|uniref:S24 family peptidase n=1 Tax=Roseinatronobacter alkalisoli TaxID=3028235 RepID=A0ABT5TE81_9RHOB|nr:S24 family peptidase [Roseinatronobacter sp. HJB301]MDD7973425.1 S24 family peptidase [Roseinatronobacter sp. HJB301]